MIITPGGRAKLVGRAPFQGETLSIKIRRYCPPLEVVDRLSKGFLGIFWSSCTERVWVLPRRKDEKFKLPVEFHRT